MKLSSAPVLRRASDFDSQRFAASFAADPSEVKEAQRLRHRVFIEEMGASARAPGSAVERDRFDPFCLHLLVRDRSTGKVVGTYRVLTPERAAALGAFMCERQFDLTALGSLRDRIVEVGRACIDRNYRCGATIMLLWSGLASFAQARGYGFLFGCVTVGVGGQPFDTHALYRRLTERYLAPPEYRVLPRADVPVCAGASAAPLPPLLKGYLRAGAWICGEPSWDPEFGTADLPVLLPLSRIESRYARHFLHVGATATAIGA